MNDSAISGPVAANPKCCISSLKFMDHRKLGMRVWGLESEVLQELRKKKRIRERSMWSCCKEPETL